MVRAVWRVVHYRGGSHRSMQCSIEMSAHRLGGYGSILLAMALPILSAARSMSRSPR